MKRLLGVMLASLLAVGCDDDGVGINSSGGSSGERGVSAATLENLSGAWISDERQGSGRNIYLFDIGTDGKSYDFTFLGDTAVGGTFCYQLNQDGNDNRIRFTPLGNGRFLLTTLYDGQWISSYANALISNDQQSLTLTYQDIFDVDLDGNTDEFQTLSLQATDRVSVNDFAPRCDNAFPFSPPKLSRPSSERLTLDGNLTFETRQAIIANILEGDWRLSWKSRQPLSLYQQENLAGGEIYGSMFINNGLVTMVSEDYPAEPGGHHVVSFQFEFASSGDSQTQWLSATRIDHCEQRVQINAAADWSLLIMNFMGNSCDHLVETSYVWTRNW